MAKASKQAREPVLGMTDPEIEQRIFDEVKNAFENKSDDLNVRVGHPQVLAAVCQLTWLTKLTLNFQDQKHALPEALTALTGLKSLTIEDYTPTTLPAFIGKFSELEKLTIYSNKLKSLPEEFGHLRKLTEITAWSNELTELPESFGQLENLVELDLHNNKLKSLPKSFGSLKKLVVCDLSGNELSELPASVKNLSSLTGLKLSDNKFTEFPEMLCQLPQLEYINLDGDEYQNGQGNSLKSLPPNLGKIVGLRRLRLAHNALTTLPASLFTLPKLFELDLENNKLTEVPAAVGQLPALLTLKVHKNPLKNVPAEVAAKGKFAVLTHLGVRTPKTLNEPLSAEERKALVAAREADFETLARAVKKKYRSDEDVTKQVLAFLAGKVDVVPELTAEQAEAFEDLPEFLKPYAEWSFIDRRAVMLIAGEGWSVERFNNFSLRYYAHGLHEPFFAWVKKQLENDPPDLMTRLAAELTGLGVSVEQLVVATCTELSELLQTGSRPTSAGRFLLANTQLIPSMLSATEGKTTRGPLVKLLVGHALKAFEPFVETVLTDELKPSDSGTVHAPYEELEALLSVNSAKYTKWVETFFEKTTCLGCRAELVRVKRDVLKGSDAEILPLAKGILEAIAVEKKKNERYDFAWSAAKRYEDGTPEFIDWVLTSFGAKAREFVFAYVEGTKVMNLKVIEVVARHLGQAGLDIVAEALNMTIDDAELAAHFETVFRLLAPLDFTKYLDKVWEVASCEFAPIREAAARALAKLGEKVVLEKAIAQLAASKADHRDAGARVLVQLGTKPALKALAAAVDEEVNDDVRDVMVAALTSAKASPEEIERRVDVAAKRGKLKKAPATWFDVKKLPALKWAATKKALKPDVVAFLAYRQSRVGELVADVEAAPIIAALERGSAGDFALDLHKKLEKSGGYVAKNRFAMSLVGLLGDDRVVEPLEQLALTKQNVNATEALGLIGTDEAVRALDAIMREYRTRYPNVEGAARDAFEAIAARRKVSPLELGDKLVPGLGFEGLSRAFKLGTKKVELRLTAAGKVAVFEKGAEIPLPKDASKAVKDELKALEKEAKEHLKLKREKFEADLVAGRRWPAATWRALIESHALQAAAAQHFIWGAWKGETVTATFKVHPDLSTVDETGAAVSVPASSTVGLVHPLLLDAATRERWVKAGFPAQLERPTFMPDEEERNHAFCFRFEDATKSSGTFRSRAGRTGWRRGSVVDAGEVSTYRKTFHAQGVDAFIDLDGLNVQSGYDDGEEVTLKHLFFVPTGSVSVGSYQYDEPKDEKDSRLINLGKVPPLVFSEALRDLQLITA